MYPHLSPTLNVMINAVRKAGRLLLRDFNEISNGAIKTSLEDFVRAAEVRSEKMLMQDLKDFNASYNFLSEGIAFEAGEKKDYTWIIDPLDGTVNFLQGLPIFCITVALRKKNEITHGVIYDPILDYIYYAERGQGAYVNNTRIRTPLKSRISNGVVSFDRQTYLNDDYRKIIDNFHYLRYLGSTVLSLAYVASGKLDLFIRNTPELWDIAAGVILIREAGGKIDDLYKQHSVLETKHILAGNVTQFDKVYRVLHGS